MSVRPVGPIADENIFHIEDVDTSTYWRRDRQTGVWNLNFNKLIEYEQDRFKRLYPAYYENEEMLQGTYYDQQGLPLQLTFEEQRSIWEQFYENEARKRRDGPESNPYPANFVPAGFLYAPNLKFPHCADIRQHPLYRAWVAELMSDMD